MVAIRTFFMFSTICIVLFALAPNPCLAQGIEAITRPSKDVTLSFVRPGRVAEIKVKEGDEVKTGQVLVRQDDAAERVQLEQLRITAEDTTHIKAAEAQMAQKKVYLKRLQQAAEHGAATKTEVELAELDVTIAELSLELAKLQQGQDKRKYAEAKIHVERMQIKSPIGGKVEKIFFEQGESADALKEVVTVVNIDTMWIEVPVALEQAKGLKLGGAARVEFFGKDGEVVEGKIIHKCAVADAASDTLTIRVEIPNLSGRPAGEHVKVSFPVAKDTSDSHSDKSEVTQPKDDLKKE